MSHQNEDIMVYDECLLFFLCRIHDVMMAGESKIHIHLTACQNVGPQNSLTDPDVLGKANN